MSWFSPIDVQPVSVVQALALIGLARVSNGRKKVTADELLASIREGRCCPVVDVRSRAEYMEGHVPGALHIPFHAIRSRHVEIPAAKEDPVVVYCHYGPRAWVARFILHRAGFRKVLCLAGHMLSWEKQGLPTEAGKR